ncbi:hypothetical protein [Thermus caldifontis]|nr:hypothetical protein [Thermus caldifontis]
MSPKWVPYLRAKGLEALLNVERYLEGGGVAVVEDQRVRYRSLP